MKPEDRYLNRKIITTAQGFTAITNQKKIQRQINFYRLNLLLWPGFDFAQP
jgi:hypothetical protein